MQTKIDTSLNEARGEIPLAFMQAMSMPVYGGEPKLDRPGEGYFQITKSILDTYNKAMESRQAKSGLPSAFFKPEDLDKPLNSAEVAAWAFNEIANSLVLDHPTAFPKGVDWTDKRLWGLVALAFHSNSSETDGVGKVLSSMESLKLAPEKFTAVNVMDAAEKMKNVSPSVSSDGTRSFVTSVLYRSVSGNAELPTIDVKPPTVSEAIKSSVNDAYNKAVDKKNNALLAKMNNREPSMYEGNGGATLAILGITAGVAMALGSSNTKRRNKVHHVKAPFKNRHSK